MTIDDIRITAFALDELPLAERTGVEAELNHSVECRREAGAVLRFADLLRAEFATEPSPGLSHERKTGHRI